MSIRHIIGISLLIIAAAIFLIPFDKAPSKSSPPIADLPPVTASGSEEEQIVVANMTDVLVAACPGIQTYAADIVSMSGRVAEIGLDSGWQQAAQIEVVISDQPQYIPSGYHPRGQHCAFDIPLSLDAAGIHTNKSVCEFLCGGRSVVKL